MINSINESEVLVLLTLNIDILSLKYQGDRHRGLAEFVMIQFLTEISSDSRTIPNFFIQLSDLHLKHLQNILQEIRVF